MDVVEKYNGICNERITNYLIPSYGFYEAMSDNVHISFIDWVIGEACKTRYATKKKDLYKWARTKVGEAAVDEYVNSIDFTKPEYFNLTEFIRTALFHNKREEMLDFEGAFVETALICILHELGHVEIDDVTYEDMRQAVLQERSTVTYDDIVKVIKEHVGETGE